MVKRTDNGGQAHLVTNIRKPKKWRKFEYLESSGIQYIDTGIHGSNTLKVKIKVLELQIGKGVAVFGLFENNSSYYLYQTGTNSKVWQVGFGAYADTSKAVDTNVHEWLFENFSIYLDNALIKTNNASTFTTTRSLLLFNMYKVDGTLYPSVSKRIYYCLIWNNNTLIRNFVPALYNGEYGMWDLVEDRFYRNQGTGSFTAGPEIKNYDEVDEVRKTDVPYDTEIEYLENTSSSYIDLDYICNDKTSVEVKFLFTTVKSLSYIFSNSTKWDAIFALYINGSTRIAYSPNNSQRYRNTNIVPDTNVHTVKFGPCTSSGTFYYDTRTNGYSAGTRRNEPLRLYASVEKYGPGLVKIYYIKFSEDGVPVCDLIPVRKGNVGYMYDKVSGKLYGNSGTGNFALGADKLSLHVINYPVWNRKLIEEPFTFRATNNKTRRRTAKLKGIKGNTVVWNQLILNGDFGSIQGWRWGGNGPLSVSGNIGTITATVTGATNLSCYQDFNMISGHKYFIQSTLKLESTLTFPANALCFHGYIGSPTQWLSSDNIENVLNKWKSYKQIVTANGDKTFLSVNIYRSGTDYTFVSGDKVHFKNVMCIDLTLMFGAGNEPSTAALFESWLDANIGLKEYYSYSLGELIPVKTSSIKTVGFNLWNVLNRTEKVSNSTWGDHLLAHPINDSEYLVGYAVSDYFYSSNILNYSIAQDRISVTTKNGGYGIGFPIRMLPNTSYYLNFNGATDNYPYRVGFYDQDGVYINNVSSRLQTFTTPSRCYWGIVNVSSGSNNGNTITNMSLNILYSNNITNQYKPYWSELKYLPITQLTGKLNGEGSSVVVFPDGMRSTGDVYDEIYVENGVTKAIKRVGSIDMGNVSNLVKRSGANYEGTGYSFCYINGFGAAKGVLNKRLVVCSLKFVTYPTIATNNSYPDALSLESNYKTVNFKIPDESLTLDLIRTYITGVIIYYELETPQEYILDNFELPLDISVEKGGTELILSNEFGASPKLLLEYII